ncbi:MAG: thiamine-phosphate kinase [Acidobacteriota bacterium]
MTHAPSRGPTSPAAIPVHGRETVAGCGERALLERIRTILVSGRHQEGVVVGIGDDGAVVAVPRNALTVLTADGAVEGVHFDRAFSTAGDIGVRALAANLSDLAAMGAEPRWALLSLALPDSTPVGEVDEMVTGIATLAAAHDVAVVGGNVTTSPSALVIDITAIGTVRPRQLLTRSGGRAGDELFVSGTVGGAAAGLEMLRSGVAADAGHPCVVRHVRPVPRVRLGLAIGRARAARAMIDLSDGLADAAHQLAEASGCGIELDAETIPIDACARAWWESNGTDPVAAALAGGDDYELLCAIPRSWQGRLRHARSRVGDPPLTRIGVLTRDRDARVLRRSGARVRLPRGYEHFGSRSAN